MAIVKKCLGIDLGTNTIKVAEMVLTANGVEVTKLASAEINLPPDAPSPDRKKETITTLKGLLKANKISTKEAVFCVPGQTVFVRRFSLPKASEERLDRIIKYEARQQIPFPIDKTILEYQIFYPEGEEGVDVFLVALKKDVLYEFMDLVNRTGLKPIGISISTLTLFNYHSFDSMLHEVYEARLGQKKKKFSFKFKLPKLKIKIKKGKKEAPESALSKEMPEQEAAPEIVRAFIHIGSTMTDMSIGSVGARSVLGFTRSIPIAGNTITQAILEKCDNVKSFQEAEGIKKEKTIILSMNALQDENTNREASEVATGVLDRIIAEIRRSLDFYISQPDGMAVDEIILTGGQTLLPYTADYLAEKIGISVLTYTQTPGDNYKGLKEKGQNLTLYPIPLGLGLMGLGQAALNIDFLPAEKKVAIKFKRKQGFVLILSSMVTGIILLGAMCGNNYINVYRDLTGKYQDEYKKHLPEIDRIKNATSLHDDLNTKFEKMARGLTSERDYPLRRWVDVINAKPPDVLVSSLMISPDGYIQIEGYTEDMSSAVTFTSNLNTDLLEKKKILDGNGARLSDIKTEYHDLFKKDVSKFTINMKVKGRYSRITQATPEPTPQQVRPMLRGRPGMRGAPGVPLEGPPEGKSGPRDASMVDREI